MNMVKMKKIIEEVESRKKVTPFVIGVCGGSGSGKTFVAKKLAEALTGHDYEVLVINQDDFSIGRHFTNKNTSKYRWDDPENYRLDECSDVLVGLLNNEVKSFKAYDLINHEPTNIKTLQFNYDKKKVIILEGIFAWYKDLANLVDYKIYVELDFYERFLLRLFRNVYKIKNVSIDKVIEQFFTHTALAHYDIVEKQKLGADKIWTQDVDMLSAGSIESKNLDRPAKLLTIYKSSDMEVCLNSNLEPRLVIIINKKVALNEIISRANYELILNFKTNS